MYQLGVSDNGKYYPRYEKSKEYMKGYNSMKSRGRKMKNKMKHDFAMIVFTVVVVLIVVLQVNYGSVR